MESSPCHTLLSKLWVTRLLPMLVSVPLPGLVGVPPPKSKAQEGRSVRIGLEFWMPIDSPKLPTDLSKVEPVFRVMWFQPKRDVVDEVIADGTSPIANNAPDRRRS